MRREQFAIRAAGFAVLVSAAVVLSGCVTTVDGRAVAAATIGPIVGTTASATTTTGTTSPTAAATTTRPAEVDEPTAADPTNPADRPVDPAAYTGLSLGDPVWVTWGDDGAEGESDLFVRSARFEETGDGSRFLVTVDYECYYGECFYDVADWTVTDTAGRQHRPESSSAFGDTGDVEDLFGTMTAISEKRGHLVFDLTAGVTTVEFDARSGDPATWLVPAT